MAYCYVLIFTLIIGNLTGVAVVILRLVHQVA